MSRNSRFLLGFVLLSTMLLSACSGSGQEELQSWMAEQRNLIKPHVEPIPAPKKFTPKAYEQDGLTEPFSSQRLAQALKRDSNNQTTSNAALVAPELNRRKEPLEAYPLDTMTMVGSLTQGTQPVALVRIDNLLYQVKVGNYLGQNYGKVTKISETEVTLREIVQDAAGEWVERTSTLQLQERSK